MFTPTLKRLAALCVKFRIWVLGERIQRLECRIETTRRRRLNEDRIEKMHSWRKIGDLSWKVFSLRDKRRELQKSITSSRRSRHLTLVYSVKGGATQHSAKAK